MPEVPVHDGKGAAWIETHTTMVEISLLICMLALVSLAESTSGLLVHCPRHWSTLLKSDYSLPLLYPKIVKRRPFWALTFMSLFREPVNLVG
jgi:hypothetical protein